MEVQPVAGAEPGMANGPQGCEADSCAQNADASPTAPSAAASMLPAPLLLPTAKQLAKADLHGAQLAQFLEDVLARHDANAERYQMRSELLQVGTRGGRVDLVVQPVCSLGKGWPRGSLQQGAVRWARSVLHHQPPPHLQTASGPCRTAWRAQMWR